MNTVARRSRSVNRLFVKYENTGWTVMRRRLIGWGLILVVGLTQAVPAPAWAAPMTGTMRATEAAQSRSLREQIKAGLEEPDQPPASPAQSRPKVLPKPAIKRLQLPPKPIAPAATTVLPIALPEPTAPPSNPQTGLEERPEFVRRGASWHVKTAGVIRGDSAEPVMDLAGGVTLAAEGGDSRIELADGTVLEPNVGLVAPQGQVIQVGPNNQILTGSKIWGNATLGKDVVFSGTIDAVRPGADVLIGDGTKFAKGSTTVMSGSVLVPTIIRVLEAGNRVVLKQEPVQVNYSSTIVNSVLFGTQLWQDAVARNVVLGPYVAMGNGAQISQSVILGADPDSRTASGAHHTNLMNLVWLPFLNRRDVLDAAQREQLYQELLALLYGTEKTRTVRSRLTIGHPVRPPVEKDVDLDGTAYHLSLEGGNAGAITTTSNLRPLEEGSIGEFLLWGGVDFGVGAIPSELVEIDAQTLVANNAVASGPKILEAGPRALVFPRAAVEAPKGEPSKVVRSSRDGLDKMEWNIEEVDADLQIRLRAIRSAEVVARAFAEGVRRADSDQQRAAHRKSLQIVQGKLNGSVEQLRRHVERVEVRISDLASKPASEFKAERETGNRVLAQRQTYEDTAREALETVARAIYTMANVQTFRRSTTAIVELKDGTPALSQEWVDRGLDKVRGKGPKPFFILFAAGSFSRYVDSVTAASPFFAQVSRERGLANDEGGPSKLMAPLGVSGLGPLMRQLGSLSELGARAGTPVDVAIVDSPGNRAMLMRAIQQDRDSSTPRIAWNYLHLVPEGAPVDQGEGLQAQYRDASGVLQPVFEFNPATGRMDKPVMRPSGELGAFLAGINAAKAAGISISERTWVPVYGDEAALFSDPAFVAALLGHADDADLTGVTINHKFENGQWVPSGGVWPEAVWPDGTTALVVAERNVRDPKAEGVFNPALDRDEQAAAPDYFPFNAAAPVFSGRFVEQELLDPDRMSRRLSSKRIQVQTGPGSSEPRDVLQTELELTEAAQIATQRAPGASPKWQAQIVETESERYRAIKFYASVEPVNHALFEEGRARLRSLLSGRLDGDPKFVEVSPRFKGFRGDGRLTITGDVGIALDSRGLWVHEKITPPAGSNAPTLFGVEGRLLIAADPEGRVPLNGNVEVTPAKKIGLEETIEQVLAAFDGRMRAWHDQQKPMVLLSDRAAVFGINSGRLRREEIIERLGAREIHVAPATLRRLLEALEAQMQFPEAQRLIGRRAAVIDLATAARLLEDADLGLTPVEALLAAVIRIQGTDGWRGQKTPNAKMAAIFGSERLSPEMVGYYHQAFIEWQIAEGRMRPGDPYLLAYDPRDDATVNGIPPMSYVRAAIAGAKRAGATVVSGGVLPIWAVALYMMWKNIPSCGEITASHNPSSDTGTKFFLKYGLKLFVEDDREVTAFFLRDLAVSGWLPNHPDRTVLYEHAVADRDEHAAAVKLAIDTSLQPENSWAQGTKPLHDWIVVVDPARGTYAGVAKDPDHPNPADPEEFGMMSTVVSGMGATVYEVGKNLGRGNVNEGCGVGDFEGSGLLVVRREDVAKYDKLRNHEMFKAMFEVADRERAVLTRGEKRLVGAMSDADGDRLYLLVYDPHQDEILVLSGDETLFVLGTHLLEVWPALRGAPSAMTAESDYRVLEWVEKLGLTRQYTAVGDKWLLLRAVTAWLEAGIRVLEQEHNPAIQEDLAALKASAGRLVGAAMRTATVVQLMDELEALAARANVPLDARLSEPGAIRFALAIEESGHAFVPMFPTRDGQQFPAFLGSGLNSLVKLLNVLQHRHPTPATRQRTVDGRDEDFYGSVRRPYPRGHKTTNYGFFVRKADWVPPASPGRRGSLAWEGMARVIEQGVPRALGADYRAVLTPQPDDPEMLYYTIRDSAGQAIGAAFVRMSGTDPKAAVYARGPKGEGDVEDRSHSLDQTLIEGRFNRLTAIMEVAVNELLGDGGHSYRARERIAKALRAAEAAAVRDPKKSAAIPLARLREMVRTTVRHVPDDEEFAGWWKLFFETQMVTKGKAFQVENGQVTLVPRALQSGDRAWVDEVVVENHTSTAPAHTGLEEVAAPVAAVPLTAATASSGIQETTVTVTTTPPGAPVSTATFDVPSVVETNKILVVGPDALPVLEALMAVRPADEGHVPVEVVVRDEAQARAATAALRRLSGSGYGDVSQQITTLEHPGTERVVMAGVTEWYRRKGFTVLEVHDATPGTLQAIGRFLGVPEPRLDAFVTVAVGLEEQALARYQ